MTASDKINTGGDGAQATHASPQPLSTGEGRDPDENHDFVDLDLTVRPYQTANKQLWSVLKYRARENRKSATYAEHMLWQAIRGNRLGHKIRRQHPIDIFIVDFVCIRKKLCIEVDGGYHLSSEQKISDDQRTFALAQKGFRVIRFSNDEVVKRLDAVLTEIKTILNSLDDTVI